MNLIERVDDMERRLKVCEDDLRKVKETINKVQGQPIIKAVYGAQFDLNDGLNAQEINGRLEKIEKTLQTL